ncbi:hypothetical protein GIB67_033714 [Kingdonia uniflora]|uniref:Uncharacterized protein n=1 Tax=Kingdonia uniflora TaxID=39325 RepID=A0A7J7P4I0_9MAGN|nr:hypothetical protein GIB67_033714 [Kingdonia uniflora]
MENTLGAKVLPEIKTEEENLTSGIFLSSAATIEPYHPVIQIAVLLAIVFSLLGRTWQSINSTTRGYRMNKETNELIKEVEELLKERDAQNGIGIERIYINE